jgi:hypothetical protein
MEDLLWSMMEFDLWRRWIPSFPLGSSFIRFQTINIFYRPIDPLDDFIDFLFEQYILSVIHTPKFLSNQSGYTPR